MIQGLGRGCFKAIEWETVNWFSECRMLLFTFLVREQQSWQQLLCYSLPPP